ncbi:regulatory protein GemA [Ancylobacter sp. A5.8]|uniref:regulatory protein GemA n=1 Tax=Ancylobacter gelatini TaxID=2919920 RepID=UPI001F4D455B|nr:regulatory protein GemA [Ancylobacter gelatini]MCJ8142946.1 regulatory protein GemA [Ancylobacter gelatini]
MTSPTQLKQIHMYRRRGDLDDGAYRALLERLTGKRSAKALSDAEAARVIAHLKGGGSRPADTATGPYAAILKALWFDAWQLGIVRSSADKAMIAWVQRQTGVDHTRFLTEPEHARPAIEGLKAWISREAGVEWPKARGDVAGAKRAIALAQFERLVAIGAWPPFGAQARPDHLDLAAYAYRRGVAVSRLEDYEERHWDWLINKLGVWLRGALKARAAA